MEGVPLPKLPVEKSSWLEAGRTVLKYAAAIVHDSFVPSSKRLTDEEHEQHLNKVFRRAPAAAGEAASQDHEMLSSPD